MSKQLPFIVMIVVFVGSLLFDNYLKKKRDQYTSHLVKLVTDGNFEEFDKEINSDEAKKNIPPANIDILKFNVAIMRNKQNDVQEIFDSFETKRLSNDAKLTIYTRALGYFTTTSDVTRCKKCYDIIMALPKNEQTKTSVQRVYEIMVEKKTDKLNELLDEVNTITGMPKCIDEFLISEIYTNMKDDVNAKKYSELAKEHLENNAELK